MRSFGYASTILLGAALFLAAAAPSTTQTAVLYLVDLSASMSEPIGLSSKRELLMDALEQQLRPLPSGAEVAIRRIGGKVPIDERKQSCADTQLESRFGQRPDLERLRALPGDGMTPLALAITHAGEDFSVARSPRRRIVVVTDGFDSCGGNPIAALEEQRRKGMEVDLQIVGIMSDRSSSLQLARLAHSFGGSFRRASDGEDLVRAVADASRGEPVENRGDLGSGIDAGTSPGSALDISAGRFTENSLGKGDESDVYRISAEKGDKAQLVVRSEWSLRAEILGPSNRKLGEKEGKFIELLLESDERGTYYLRISARDPTPRQSYEIRLDRLVSHGRSPL